MEASDQLLTTLCYKLFTLLHDIGWFDIIVVEGRYLDLDSLNAIAADITHLGGASKVLLSHN